MTLLLLCHRPNPKLARALEIMFILHAEHEMNCSTAAARHLASSGVDVYTAISGTCPSAQTIAELTQPLLTNYLQHKTGLK